MQCLRADYLLRDRLIIILFQFRSYHTEIRHDRSLQNLELQLPISACRKNQFSRTGKHQISLTWENTFLAAHLSIYMKSSPIWSC